MAKRRLIDRIVDRMYGDANQEAEEAKKEEQKDSKKSKKEKSEDKGEQPKEESKEQESKEQEPKQEEPKGSTPKAPEREEPKDSTPKEPEQKPKEEPKKEPEVAQKPEPKVAQVSKSSVVDAFEKLVEAGDEGAIRALYPLILKRLKKCPNEANALVGLAPNIASTLERQYKFVTDPDEQAPYSLEEMNEAFGIEDPDLMVERGYLRAVYCYTGTKTPASPADIEVFLARADDDSSDGTGPNSGDNAA